jgi:hypothetical protein
MDEIEKSVLEVNALLGELPTPSTSAPEEKKLNRAKEFLSVQSKHLNYQNETRKFPGVDVDDLTNKYVFLPCVSSMYIQQHVTLYTCSSIIVLILSK